MYVASQLRTGKRFKNNFILFHFSFFRLFLSIFLIIFSRKTISIFRSWYCNKSFLYLPPSLVLSTVDIVIKSKHKTGKSGKDAVKKNEKNRLNRQKGLSQNRAGLTQKNEKDCVKTWKVGLIKGKDLLNNWEGLSQNREVLPQQREGLTQ